MEKSNDKIKDFNDFINNGKKLKKLWKVKSNSTVLKNIFASQLDISEVLAQLLINRGIYTLEDAKLFLKGNLKDLDNPLLMKDMKKALDVIIYHIKSKKPILIYGDYDVDGITSVVVVVKALKSLGGVVDYYIPNRTQGYGLHSEAIRDAHEKGFSLIISVDCGITAVEEADLAKRLGIKLVITDHHEPQEVLPDAEAVINPKRKDCEYPFKELAGVGIALKLVQGLYRQLGLKDDKWQELLDIACLGTIADLVPLLGENRIIVKYGLLKLRQTNNIGLMALKEVSGLSDKSVTERDVGFILAPRINAAGRIDDPSVGVELLLTDDLEKAKELALELDLNNRERQAIEQRVLDEAVKMVESDENLLRHRVLVLASQAWHHGVIGIVASRLLRRYSRPVLMISIEGQQAKGSARSIEGFHLFKALKHCEDCLKKFGGHERAAGFSLDTDQIDNLRQKINDYASAVLEDEDLFPTIEVDKIVSLDSMTERVVREISLLAPFGEGNPLPLLAAQNVSVLDIKTVGNDNKHLKMKLRAENVIFDGIGFGLADFLNTTCVQNTKADKINVDIAFVPVINEWNGEQRIQIEIKHICERALIKRKENANEEKIYKNTCWFFPVLSDNLQVKSFYNKLSSPEYILQELNFYKKYGPITEEGNLRDDSSISDLNEKIFHFKDNMYSKITLYDYRECTNRMQVLMNVISEDEAYEKEVMTAILVNSEQQALELLYVLTAKDESLIDRIICCSKSMPEESKAKINELLISGIKNLLITTPMLLKDLDVGIKKAVFYYPPFSHGSMQRVAEATCDDGDWYFLFSTKDIANSIRVLKSFIPERKKLAILYKYLNNMKKERSKLSNDYLIRLLCKCSKMNVSSYTVALLMKILSELKLLEFYYKDNNYIIKMLERPAKKIDLSNSKTFCRSKNIVQKSLHFVSMMACEDLQKLFKRTIIDNQ